MDILKSLIPDDLKRMISESTPESLPVSCSSLLEFLLPLPPFQRVLRELTDPEMGLCRKSMEAASDSKRKGNECFSRGDYPQALSCYSQALRFAPMNSEDTNKDFMAMLYVNRAASMLKLGLYEECRRDCNRAIVLSPLYVKAWYRRAKADAALKNYEDAICDLEIAMNMEGSLSGKKHLKEELEMAVSHSNRETNISSSHDKDKNLGPCGHMALESIQLELQSVSTPAKGRGMASINSIPPATLVHYEAPFAVLERQWRALLVVYAEILDSFQETQLHNFCPYAECLTCYSDLQIVLKHCRETHCHFCLNELPADAIFCPSCTTASYCSHHCLEQARGTQSGGNQNCNTLHENFSPVLKEHVKKIVMANNAEHAEGNIKQIPEHMHECGGVNWPAVLPPDAVLAGRVLAKSVQKSSYEKISKPMKTTEFVHNYTQTPPESKLVLHIYAVVLSYCLHRYFGSNLPFTGASSSQLVILMSQIKVNSMAVVHMRSFDGCKATKQSGNLSSIENALTCNIEQVRVGQAIYSRGRLFNHSCRPNIHAYFLSRTLFLRSTEFVPAGCPLELSYGPQVGQLGLQDRKKLLQDQYSFKCQCSGCSEINLSDIVIHAFRCVKPNCFGAVLESNVTCHEHMDDNCLQVPPVVHRLELSLPVNPSHVLKASQQKKDGINKVAHLLSQTTDGMHRTGPGYCLSCGSYRDLECSNNFVIKAWINIQRLQDSIISNEDPTIVLSDALESLNLLRSTKHAYSKDVAQAEDIIAEAFCLVGQFDSAQDHCKASIEILENLYHINHIVIGHELVKLASIQISLGDRETAIKSINRLEAIFSLYYGLHVPQLFPYLESLANGAVELTH